jgi:hypothetical protein
MSVVYGAARRVAEVDESRRVVVLGSEALIVRDHRRDKPDIIWYRREVQVCPVLLGT